MVLIEPTSIPPSAGGGVGDSVLFSEHGSRHIRHPRTVRCIVYIKQEFYFSCFKRVESGLVYSECLANIWVRLESHYVTSRCLRSPSFCDPGCLHGVFRRRRGINAGVRGSRNLRGGETFFALPLALLALPCFVVFGFDKQDHR